jgi:hypothetical protein
MLKRQNCAWRVDEKGKIDQLAGHKDLFIGEREGVSKKGAPNCPVS